MGKFSNLSTKDKIFATGAAVVATTIVISNFPFQNFLNSSNNHNSVTNPPKNTSISTTTEIPESKNTSEYVVTTAPVVESTLSEPILQPSPSSDLSAPELVIAANIVGDDLYGSDRTAIRLQEAQQITQYVNGYDKNGTANFTPDKIRKAMELSDVLNDYYFSPVYYTNTTPSAVFNLDLINLYDNYQSSLIAGDSSYENFCINTQTYKPAIDAYTLFACGSMSLQIKNEINSAVNNILQSEANITLTPTTYVQNNEVFIIVGIDNQLQKITLHGDIIEKAKASCQCLEQRYNIGLNNIAGNSSYYENSFAYNGVDTVTSQSAWLSFGDDARKNDLRTSIDVAVCLVNPDDYDITIEKDDSLEALQTNEINDLIALGYNADALKKATKRNAYFDQAKILELN